MRSPFQRLLSLFLCLVLVAVALPVSPAEATENVYLKYLSYTISGGTVTITDCDPYFTGHMILPDTIEGLPVTKIGEHAFARCYMSKITLGNYVTTIGPKAFQSCTHLTIIIPASVTSIGYFAFESECGQMELHFFGDPPSFDPNAFGYGELMDIAVKAYYPIHNSNWTSDIIAKKYYVLGAYEIEWIAIHDRDEGILTAPTCTTDGSCQYTCTTCGEIETETIPALGHKWGQGTYITTATCTTGGMISYVCGTCSEIQIKTTSALGHSWDNGTVTTQPTCTEAGVRCYTCKTCSETREEAINATGHSWGESIVVGTPNCLEAVTVDHICTQCGTVGNRQTLTAPGHRYESTIEAATCTQPGRIVYTCKTCGDARSTETSPATGHQFEGGSCIHCGEPEAVSLPGDVNGDGKVNIMDVAKLYAHIKGTLLIEDETQLRQADLTGDGNVNILDIAKLYASVKGTE